MSSGLQIDERNRLFVALELPDDLREHAAVAASAISGYPETRVVPAANLHVTLQFLGRIRPAQAPDLLAALDDAFHGPVVRVRAGDVVPRPSPGRARLVALGLEDVDGGLTILAKRIHRAIAIALGGTASNGPVWPHITIARFRRPERVRRSPTTRSERVFDIVRVALYDSDIAPGRSPKYHELLGTTLGTLAQRSSFHG